MPNNNWKTNARVCDLKPSMGDRSLTMPHPSAFYDGAAMNDMCKDKLPTPHGHRDPSGHGLLGALVRSAGYLQRTHGGEGP